MKIETKILGKIKGHDVISYNLINPNGIEVRVLNYGGIITDIIVQDKNGIRENIVLKYKNLESYENNPSYFGAFIGRTAGRICNGEAKLNGQKLEFNKNYTLHQGHGGNEGFDKKLYNVNTYINENDCEIELSRVSLDGEESYPGNLNVKVKYILNNKNELKIKYFGISDKDTLVNFTNHSYFNLSGNCKENILDHKLYINSDKIIELNELQVPTGALLEVDNTEFDFRKIKNIGKDINGKHIQLKYSNGYDIPWYIEGKTGPQLILLHEESGRRIEITTDRKSIVVYTHNYPDNEVLESGANGKSRLGIAIEPQNPPIGVNGCFTEDSILLANNKYSTETIYRISSN